MAHRRSRRTMLKQTRNFMFATALLTSEMQPTAKAAEVELPNLWPDTEGWNQPQYYATIQTADIDGDGRDELLARSVGGISIAKWDLSTLKWSLLPAGPALSDTAGWNQSQYYSTIQCADIDGDGQDELLVRGTGGMLIFKCNKTTYQWVPLPSGPGWSDTASWNQPQYYNTIQCADIDGDGRAELLGRGSGGMQIFKYNTTALQWVPLPSGPGWSDAAGWNQPQYYNTIQCADIDGDGRAELLGRGSGGMQIFKYNTTALQWVPLPSGPSWNDVSGWNQIPYYSTIQAADIDGDGRAELLGRGVAGMQIFKYNTTTLQWGPFSGGPAWNDVSGWNQSQYYSTIQCADIDGDGQAELLGRGAAGMQIFKYNTTTLQWVGLSGGPTWSDASGWNQPQYYTTIQCAEIDGYGQAEIIGRGTGGMIVFQRSSTYVTTWESLLQQAAADPVYKNTLLADPITQLQNAGIVIPAAQQTAAIQLVTLILANPPLQPDVPKKRNLAKTTVASQYVSASASWYGLTIYLSTQAIADNNNGINIGGSIAAAAATALTSKAIEIGVITLAPEMALVIALVVAYLKVVASLMGLINRGNGVDLVIPWTSFNPLPPPWGTAGLIIPLPHNG